MHVVPLTKGDLKQIKAGDVLLYNPTLFERMKLITSSFDDLPSLTPVIVVEVRDSMYIRVEGHVESVFYTFFSRPLEETKGRT